MNQPVLVALIAVILFLMWMSIDLWEIHKNISELRALLSSALEKRDVKHQDD